MAKNDSVSLVADAWTQLTDDDCTRITVVNEGPDTVWVSGTTSASAPSDKSGAYPIPPGQSVSDDMTALWPGLAAVRVYAITHVVGHVSVSHD